MFKKGQKKRASENYAKSPHAKKNRQGDYPKVIVTMNEENDTMLRQVKFRNKKFENLKDMGVSKNLYERKIRSEKRFDNNRTAFNREILAFLENVKVTSGKNHDIRYNSLIIDFLDKIQPLEDTQGLEHQQMQDLSRLHDKKKILDKLWLYKKALTAATAIVDAGVCKWEIHDVELGKSSLALINLQRMISYVEYTSKRELNNGSKKKYARFSKGLPKNSMKADFETIMPEKCYVKIMAMNNANMAINELIGLMDSSYFRTRGVALIYGKSRFCSAILTPVNGLEFGNKQDNWRSNFEENMAKLQKQSVEESQNLSVDVIPKLMKTNNDATKCSGRGTCHFSCSMFETAMVHLVNQVLKGLNVIQRNVGYQQPCENVCESVRVEKVEKCSYELDPLGTDSDDERLQTINKF